MLVLSANLLNDRSSRDTRAARPELQRSNPPKFSADDYRQNRFPKLTGRPLIGVNYTHYAFPNCTFLRRNYVIAGYQNPGGATKVHEQLRQMRRSGIGSLRTVVWYDAAGQAWGPIPAPGGALLEPFRTNLVRYVTEIRRFGFARLTIAFEPKGSDNPLPRMYQPSLFAENWRIIQAVRAIVKRYGPSRTRFDLFSEGAPNQTPTSYEPYPPQTAHYIAQLYRAYVRRFGNGDVTISAIGSMDPVRRTNRVQNLIHILKSTGEPLPKWYDVHLGSDATGATYALSEAEKELRAERQYQPLVVGDAGYDNSSLARLLARYVKTSSRPLQEVTPWYTYTRYGCPVQPPYSPGAYGQELHRISAK
jgi:hypothetical protein